MRITGAHVTLFAASAATLGGIYLIHEGQRSERQVAKFDAHDFKVFFMHAE
jgi:hypothetical protein